jgi:hypothetical protein
VSASATERVVCCDACGQPIEGRQQVRKENFHSGSCRSRQSRRVNAEPFDKTSSALLEQAELARRAIRAGADPYLVLSVLIWPPDSPDDARRLVGAAA